MNNCCNSCPHLNIDSELKDLYNRYAKKTFDLDNCPLNDDKIVCFLKHLPIGWDDFKDFLNINGITVTNGTE